MKPGIPWNLKRVDEDTRLAVIEAARRSGMTVGEWLNRALAPDGPGYAEPEPPAAEDLAAAMAEIKDRLDEIERGMRRPEPPRQKSVAEMVAEIAREIESPDERARSSVEGLRGQSNRAPAVPPHPDDNRFADALRALDRQIAEMGPRIAPAATPESRHAPLDDIRSRLDSLLAQAPKAEAPGPPPPRRPEPAAAVEAALMALENRIEAARAELVRRDTPAPAAATEPFARLEAQLADIREHLAKPDDRPARTKDADIASAVREIAAHQKSLDDRAETFALRRDQQALSAAMAAIRADIAALTEQVAAIGRPGADEHEAYLDLSHRIDALLAEAPSDRRLLTIIHNELGDLRDLIETTARETTLDTIAAHSDVLAEQMNALLAGSPNRKQVEALGEEVVMLRSLLEADDSPRAIKRLETRIAEMGQTLDAILAAQQAQTEPGPVLEQLEERLKEISGKLETLREPVMPVAVAAAIASAQHQAEARFDDLASRLGGLSTALPRQAATLQSLEERLQMVVERIDDLTLAQQEPSRALDLIQSEIRTLRAELQTQQAAPDTGHLEAQIRDLAHHLDTVVQSAPDAGALAALERQVDTLAGELAAARPQVAAVGHLEENLSRLQTLLANATRDSIAGARAEAQQAVTQLSELIAEYEIDSDLVRSLMRDLDALKKAAGTSDESAYAQMKIVEQTLAEVTDRLARLEQRSSAPTEDHGAGTPAPAAVRNAEARVDGAADVAALAGRRVDFIAAARRAAQSASTPPAAAPAPVARPEPVVVIKTLAGEPSEERKPGAFAKISQAIRNRKRPLLFAAAAIVIAIGALQIFGRVALTPGAAPETAAAEVAAVAPAEESETAAPEALDTAAAPAVVVPEVAEAEDPPLAPPPARPTAAIAFAQPEALDSRFAEAPDAPLPGSFAARTPTAAAAEPDAGSGSYYRSGLDPRVGDDRLLRAADDGDPAAAFEVARRYAEGSRVPKDLAEAAEWYRRAAEGGIAVAQYRLASLYERGQGVTQDRLEAVNWYQRAADQGNVNAMHNLAVMMSEGVEGAPDHDKALQWFLAAGNYGVRDSQYNLGVIFARGLGPEQDLVESYKWFAIAAAQGDTDASARRDEVAKAMSRAEHDAAVAVVAAWHVQPTIADANGVSAPEGGWDGPGDGFAVAEREALVRKIQILLAEQGYDPGPADGVAGPKTVEAVRAYQRQIGQPETGEIDSVLIASLDGGAM